MYDQGEYICVAENSVGRVDAAANIVVVPDPNNRRYLPCDISPKSRGTTNKGTKNIGCTHLLFSGEGEGEEAGPGKVYHLPGAWMIEGLQYSLLNPVRFEMMYFPFSDSELLLKRRA